MVFQQRVLHRVAEFAAFDDPCQVHFDVGADGPRRWFYAHRHLPEHHGARPVQQDAVLRLVAHGAREHLGLDVAPGRFEFLGCLAMVDAFGVLLDDRSLVEVGGDVVRSRADDLPG